MDPPMEILSSRIFAVPPARLFGMFGDPSRLCAWWGPSGFTCTFHEFDFRPGGKWRFTMHGPDRKDYENEKTFVEIVEPERIVFDHSEPMHSFRMTMDYSPLAEGKATRLTWRMAFEEGAGNEKFRDFIAVANEQNFDRLEAQLQETTP
jgi:uncharacterized protein YndB with AHSA1/START domain